MELFQKEKIYLEIEEEQKLTEEEQIKVGRLQKEIYDLQKHKEEEQTKIDKLQKEKEKEQKKIDQLQKEINELQKQKQTEINKKMEEDYDDYNNEEETSFIDDDVGDWDYYIALDWIEDPDFKEKVSKRLENLPDDKNEKQKIYKNALLDGISTLQISDKLVDDEWDKIILLDEKRKFEWEGKIKIFNEVFFDKNIFFPYDNKTVIDFFERTIEETKTPEREEVNGFTFLDKKIIKRGKNRKFYYIEGIQLDRFLESYNNILGNSAASVFTEKIGGTSQNTKDLKSFADDYIFEMREEQKRLIREMKPGEEIELREMKENSKEINDISNEIDKIKKNKKFKVRLSIWKKTIGGGLYGIIKWIKKVGAKTGWGVVAAVIGIIISIGAFIAQLELEMKKGATFIEAVGKKFQELKDYISNNPYKSLTVLSSILGYFFGFFGKFMYLFSKFLGFVFSRCVLIPTAAIGAIIAYFTDLLDHINEQINWGKLKISLMKNEEPDNGVVEILCEKRGLTPEEFRKLFSGESKHSNSGFSKAVATIASPFLDAADMLTKKGIQLTEIIAKYLNYLLLLFVIYIIIKWRS